jgi:undecaprenyl diphosphate synthase
MKHLSTKPKCIGIIMDGNRRWAKEAGRPSLDGHRQGYLKLREVMRWAKVAHIEYVIVYGFSTENWNRAKSEVSYLMDLIRFVFRDELEDIIKEGIRIKCIGEENRLPKDIPDIFAEAEKRTSKNKDITLVAAISYGGRKELVDAVNHILRTNGKHDISEDDLSAALYTKDIPDPDLIIRTGGEMRTSGFLPYQSVYSELFFVKNHWPAFSRSDFNKVLDEFAARSRRFGV